jgi:hypothetical protein
MSTTEPTTQTKQVLFLEKELRPQIEKELRPQIEKEIREKLEPEIDAKYAEILKEEVAKLRKYNDEQLAGVITDWKKELKPPSQEEVSQLLNQEYFEFEVALSTLEGKKTFIIRELPQAIEKKFYKQLKNSFMPRIQEFTKIFIEMSDKGDLEQKLITMLDMFEPLLDILTDVTVIILDPHAKDGITRQWVQDNLSSFRMWNLIVAQEMANRVRNFFSVASQSSLDGRMMGVSIQK